MDLRPEIQAARINFLKGGGASRPSSSENSGQAALATLRKKFEELHNGAHPLRRALDKLQTLETIRILEGKA
ncbi:MAG: hypothetical protein SNJ84_09765 [Verrucomicrobiia bacterium]